MEWLKNSKKIVNYYKHCTLHSCLIFHCITHLFKWIMNNSWWHIPCKPFFLFEIPQCYGNWWTSYSHKWAKYINTLYSTWIPNHQSTVESVRLRDLHSSITVACLSHETLHESVIVFSTVQCMQNQGNFQSTHAKEYQALFHTRCRIVSKHRYLDWVQFFEHMLIYIKLILNPIFLLLFFSFIL